MIKISRGDTVPAALQLSGVKEKNDAIRYFAARGNKKSFDFKAYKHPEVKNLLIAIFKGKCAYCESKFLAIYPGDIEHFRPKGAVIDKVYDNKKGKFVSVVRSKNGYYWLAADWDNLLLSCKLCNQEQTYKMADGASMVLGKKNQFPLQSRYESRRIKKPLKEKEKDQISKEDKYRLIIDPCKEDPAMFFIYDEKHGLIKPKTEKGNLFRKADTSIRVYALQRMPLVAARQELLIDIQAQQQRILDLHRDLDKVIGKKDDVSVALQLFFEKKLGNELSFLRDRYLRPEQPFLGMTTYIIGKFLKEQFGIDIHDPLERAGRTG